MAELRRIKENVKNLIEAQVKNEKLFLEAQNRAERMEKDMLEPKTMFAQFMKLQGVKPGADYSSYSGAEGCSPACQGNGLVPMSSLSLTSVQALVEKGKGNFMVDFLMEGVSAVVSKTTIAPIECVKFFIQNQDEMSKVSRHSEPYKGISDCFVRIIEDEGVITLWRGNTTNAIRYFPI